MTIVSVVMPGDVVPVAVGVTMAVAVGVTMAVAVAVGMSVAFTILAADVAFAVASVTPAVAVVAVVGAGAGGTGGDTEHKSGQAGDDPVRAHDEVLSRWRRGRERATSLIASRLNRHGGSAGG